MDLQGTLASFFAQEAFLDPGDRVLVAFSGGADSTALLVALKELGRLREVLIEAAHIDHGLDAGSRTRAEFAAHIAGKLDLPLMVSRCDVAAERRRGESLELAARRVRYRELERLRLETGARYIATAHHCGDQAETVLMRLGAGHGITALAAIPSRRGPIVRPLLSRHRRELVDFLRARGFDWIEDPTNSVLAVPRNRLRHFLLPRLAADTPDLAARLARLAGVAARANLRLSRVLDDWLEPRTEGSATHVSRRRLADAPVPLLPFAVTHLLRGAGCRRRPSRGALAHLHGLLAQREPVAVDLGGGWRMEDSAGAELRVLQPAARTAPFAYNLEVPGEVRLGELSSSFRLLPGCSEPWMFRGSPLRAGLDLALEPGIQLTVRNRRPGDRVQPLGSRHHKKLKDLLIDHGVPRNERDRLPLLCHSDRILWVPGVTIDHETRIREGSRVWIAEIVPDE